MKKILKGLLMLLIFLTIFLPNIALAQEKNITIHVFGTYTCSNCENAKMYLNTLKDKYENINIIYYEINEKENSTFFNKTLKFFNQKTPRVPFIVIGNQTLTGFSLGITDKQIETIIINYQIGKNEYHDYVDAILKDETEKLPPLKENIIPEKINIPFFGDITLKNLSLPIITIILGVLDGFNPCAMWVLLFLISTLLGLNDKKKIKIYGFTFILTSAVIYYIFMSAWLNLAIFASTLFWFRLLIAIIAFIGGSINIYNAFKEDDGCTVIDEKKRTKIFTRIKSFVQEKQLVLALLGIIFLAISVNIIELFCSAGFPVIYTQILAMNNLSPIFYYLYLIFYVLFFMLDDILIFLVAIKTLELKAFSTKYSRITKIIGGILMIIIGLLLLINPNLLSFS